MNQPIESSSRPATARVVALLLAAALVAAGCGSRQTRGDVEAAARGSLASADGSLGTSGLAPGSDGVSTAGDVATAGQAGARDGATATGDGGTNAPTAGGPDAPQSAGTPGGGNAAGALGAEGGGLADGAPIVIGNVSTTSGLQGSAQAPGVRGLQAWVAATNAAGGVNGHPIRLVLADDGGDPARHASAVKDLVENQGVVAFVSNWASSTIQASRSYLEERRIPVIGGDSSTSNWFESPMLFPQGPTPDEFMRARLRALSELTDLRTVATIVCREAAVCSEFAGAVRRHAGEFGFTLVYEGQGSLAQPDFTAECLSARNAGAELVLPVFDASTIRRIAQSCGRQNYHPGYDLLGAVDPDFPGIPDFEGATLSHSTFPPSADHPTANAFREALATYQPDQPPLPIAASGWAAGMLFGQVAAAAFPAGATPSTPPLLDALWSLENDTVSGALGPLTFRRDQPAGPTAPRCVFTQRIAGGEWTAPKGMEPTCV